MALNSVRSVSTGLPVMFLEARMHGSCQSVLSQLGFSIDFDQCSVALFTRTSGIVLIAGVSSYLAYRIFAKILGNRFLWTVVDFARIDLLNRAEIRLFCQQTEENYKHRDRNASVCDEDCSDWESFYNGHFSDSTEITFLSPESSPVRCCRWVVAHSPCSAAHSPYRGESSQSRLLFGSLPKAEGDKVDRIYSVGGGSTALRRLSEVSTTVSEQSSSLRLQWDDPSWESRSDLIGQGIARRCQSLSPSNVSDFSEFRAARKIFDDLTTLSFDDHGGIDEGYMDATPTGEESSGSISETHEFIERSCMTDSKHLYRIVSGCSPGSDTFSVSSNLTTRSFQSLRHCAASTSFSNGLLDLTHSPTSSTSATDTFSNSMTDSAISRGSASTGDERWIGTFPNEMNCSTRISVKSDDFGSATPCVEDCVTPCYLKKGKDNGSFDDQHLFIIRRTDLYDAKLSGPSFKSQAFKRFELSAVEFSEDAILYEAYQEDKTVKVDGTTSRKEMADIIHLPYAKNNTEVFGKKLKGSLDFGEK